MSIKSKAEKKSSSEEGKFKKQIEEERERMIEAKIIRVMEVRRELNESDLLSEVIERITLFQPQQEMIRKRIDYLIERNFIVKDKEQPGVLVCST